MPPVVERCIEHHPGQHVDVPVEPPVPSQQGSGGAETLVGLLERGRGPQGSLVVDGLGGGEQFDFTFLPEDTEALFREALDCYSMNAVNAFASMCRRTIQRVFADLGETGKMRIFEQCNDIRDMAEVDDGTFNAVRRVLFDSDSGREGMPMIRPAQAGVLLEFMRDILYESYVRKGRLQQAMMMRRYVAESSEDSLKAGNGG